MSDSSKSRRPRRSAERNTSRARAPVRSVTRSKRDDRKDQRARVLAALLEATESLLAEGGSYTELSVETLSRAAGISRSTYYLYFRDKGQLLSALTQFIAEEMIDTSRRWWEIAPACTPDQLRAAMFETMKIYQRHQAIFAALAETASYDPAVNKCFDGLLSIMANRSLQSIHAGKRSGTVRQKVNEDSFMALIWMAERVAYRWVRNGSEAGLHRAADIISDLLWHSLYLA